MIQKAVFFNEGRSGNRYKDHSAARDENRVRKCDMACDSHDISASFSELFGIYRSNNANFMFRKELDVLKEK